MIEEESSGTIVHTVGPLIRHWRETNSLVTIELREGGLQLNMFYSATVNVNTLAGNESINFTISEHVITLVAVGSVYSFVPNFHRGSIIIVCANFSINHTLLQHQR